MPRRAAAAAAGDVAGGQCWQPRQYDVTNPPGLHLGDPRPAARAGLAALVVHGEEVADLLLERRRDALAQDRRSRRPASRASRDRASSISSGARRRPLPERQQARPRAGSRRCRRCRSRRRTPGSGAGSSARPGGAGCAVTPDVEGQRRIDRASGPARRRPARAWPARRRRAAGRPCPSGSGRGSGPRAWPSSPGIQAAPRVQAAASGRRAVRPRAERRGPRPSWSAACRRGRRQLEASGEHRVASTTASRSRSKIRNLPRPADRLDALPDEGRELGRRASDGERPGAARPTLIEPTRRGRRGARRRPRSGRAVRARRDDCSARKACARLSRP